MLFSESIMGVLSVWLDIGIGILGAAFGILAGTFVPKGTFKTLVLSLNILAVSAGMLLLGVGLYAFGSGEPYATWFLFVRTGLILVFVFAPLFIVVKNAYQRFRMLELEKMKRADLA